MNVKTNFRPQRCNFDSYLAGLSFRGKAFIEYIVACCGHCSPTRPDCADPLRDRAPNLRRKHGYIIEQSVRIRRSRAVGTTIYASRQQQETSATRTC